MDLHVLYISSLCQTLGDHWLICISTFEPCYAMFNAVRARMANGVYILGDNVPNFKHLYSDDFMILDPRFNMIIMIMLETGNVSFSLRLAWICLASSL